MDLEKDVVVVATVEKEEAVAVLVVKVVDVNVLPDSAVAVGVVIQELLSLNRKFSSEKKRKNN